MEQDALRERLLYDTPWFSENAPFQIVDKSKQLIPFVWKPAQLKVFRAIERQRLARKPVRIIVLKARQWGCSTAVAAIMAQRVTQMPNRNARIVAHKKEAARSLFKMVERMYANLPEDLKPSVGQFRKNEYIEFSEESVAARLAGEFGLNSTIQVDTASELGGGRGDTLSELHGSEVAFWPDIPEKMSSLLEGVPYEEGTFVTFESTANGMNEWQRLCEDAENGENEYEFVFVGWWEDADYEKPFANDADRDEFAATIGVGEVGRAEPDLLELFAANGISHETALRKLHWRRAKIASPSIAFDMTKFMREYPATPTDAFQASENTVFSQALVAKVVERTRDTDLGADPGLFIMGESKMRRGRVSEIEVPQSAIWVPAEKTGFTAAHAFWRIWEHPYRRGEKLPKLNPDFNPEDPDASAERDGQYIVSVDSAGDSTINNEEGDFDAIEVIDHRSGRQVAEYVSHRDSDELALEALLAAIYWNRAWLVVEKTGNYGVPILQRLQFDYGYEFLYQRARAPDDRKGAESDRLGWDTQVATKRVLVDLGKELLRTQSDGIRSFALAQEMTTYVKNDRGSMNARKGKHDDRLMAWMIAQQVGREKPLRPDKRPTRPTSWTRPPIDPVTGW